MSRVNNKNTSDLVVDVLVFLLLALNIFHTFIVSVVDFEQVNISWAIPPICFTVHKIEQNQVTT